MRIIDDLLSIELAPGEPTAIQAQELFGREIADVLQTQEDTEGGYTTLISKIKTLSAEKKIEILELPLDPQSATHGKYFVHILRAQSTLAQGTEQSVIRAGENNFKARVADVLLPDLLARLAVERQRLAALPFRRSLD